MANQVLPAVRVPVVQHPGVCRCLGCGKMFESECKRTLRFCRKCRRRLNANVPGVVRKAGSPVTRRGGVKPE